MPQKSKTYEEKMQELEENVAQIESRSLPLNQLVAKLKSSLKLVEECQKELQRIETDANRLLQHEQE
ncbi:MAG: exodeoxyribonuclease VII small subunit [Bacteroidales bacterium]|nr:exodeoxyribonuclease VII small subunit [Bacteroidales bacterium]MCI7272742.1 exodeoxyribonuclease VII small subunit [bacterium]MDD6731458.1 exodeoxyribonuclease VII small subunit [Bacteroidales bacterium]MDY4558103.1 exodeoxyribonuclease VII small subunit [Alloprevotella sp.]